jgi:hypothetical protein
MNLVAPLFRSVSGSLRRRLMRDDPLDIQRAAKHAERSFDPSDRIQRSHRGTRDTQKTQQRQ